MRRVVVTGMGAITPLGNNVNDFWNGIKNENVGIDKITKFDTENFRVKLAAEVKNYSPDECMDFKSAKRMALFCQYAVSAAIEALKDADINMKKEDAYRVGVSVGSGVGSLQSVEKETYTLFNRGQGRINPLFVPMMITNMAAGNISIQTGAKGKSINVVTACATGTNSIGEAYRTIQYGDADVMIAGGTEAAVTQIGIGGFMALKALSTSDNPLRASIPFDRDRGGFVMGEGAGIVILEELEHAKRRGAKILAEVAGYGNSSDAYHITSPAEDGSGAARAMENAVNDAGIKKEDVFYINSHGTGTHLNDLFETRAIKLAFGKHAGDMYINSTKSMIGHMLGAAGAVEFITCVKEINEGYIHKTVGLENPDEELDLNYVKDKAINIDVNYALTNSLGFGGHNSSLLVKKYVE
ncbi:MAG: beta-ketoacyl-ACP synthase II [Lachnospiraceae bacterium]|nr:beta-ketoacyl-ACP synthase II [Lachnospiraceae bacterium]MDY2607752.1 beta-ketoacyl-ACP synthase II [Lachnospiraceae bacterium]